MNTTTLNMTTLDGGNVIIKKGEGGGTTPTPMPSAPIAENDVTFYDYDGTVLYAYTKEEFLALTAMPPLPTRERLICQEWNWTWEEAYDYVSKYGACMIGATYITDDGSTRLYMNIESPLQKRANIYLSQTVDKGTTIHWGDGTSTIVDGTEEKEVEHTYDKLGEYVISISVIDGCITTLGGYYDDIFYYNEPLGLSLMKIETGKNIAFNKYALSSYYHICLSSIIYNKDCESYFYPGSIIVLNRSVKTFSYSKSDRLVVLSPTLESVGLSSSSIDNDDNIFVRKIFIPEGTLLENKPQSGNPIELDHRGLTHFISRPGISSSGINFENCTELYEINYHIDAAEMNKCDVLKNTKITKWAIQRGLLRRDSMFENCVFLKEVVCDIIPEGTILLGGNIPKRCFADCVSLKNFTYPLCTSYVTHLIGEEAFYNCILLEFVDLSNRTELMTLSNVNAFEYTPETLKIIVPDNLYDAWIAATNWSAIADKIIKKSDWDALNA